MAVERQDGDELLVRREVGRVEGQGREDFVGDQVDGFGLARRRQNES